MSDSNPFSIRLQTLQMAKDYLDKQYEVNVEFAKQAMEMWKEQGKDVQEYLTEVMPKMYDPKEIKQRAEELYEFISTKK